MNPAQGSPYPPKPPMVACPHCGSMNEDDGRKNCRNCHKPMTGRSGSPVYCQCGKVLHTKHCLAKLFQCSPRAAQRMAAIGRWRSTRVPVGAGGAGEYRWTNEMIAEIITSGERQPEQASEQPNAPAVPSAQPKQRRVRQQKPAPIPNSNVRPLVAKQPRRAS